MMRYRLLFFSALAGISVLAFIPTYEPLPPVVSFSDILNHFAAFSVLAILYRPAFPARSYRFKILTLFLYGVVIEIVQHFLPNRDASVKDIAIDAAAILSTYALLFVRENPLRRRR